MALFRQTSELLPERRDNAGSVIWSYERNEYGSRARRGRRFGYAIRRRLSFWMFLLVLLFLIYMSIFGKNLPLNGKFESETSPQRDIHQGTSGQYSLEPPSKHRKQHFPCDVGFVESVDELVEPKEYMNFSQFTLGYLEREDITYGDHKFEPRFGGHQTLEERENSFYAKNHTVHCGFVRGPEGSLSSGFDLYEKDKEYMNTCRIVVSSCIFGSFDFLRRPTSRKIGDYSKQNVCFVMFLDEQTMAKLSLEGHVPNDDGYIGLWRIVIVRNLPYTDMRRTGKVPKFLSHRLFPSARYSIWLDSKMRLQTDPMQILEYFLWRKGSEYAISNHYDRHCVWEEVLQNKRLNKYNHTAIDEQFIFYQSDGLTKFDPSDPDIPLPSYVPEGSFIVRAHSPMSNLFSCLWFNEVDRFTSRDQLSFAYTYLKLRRMNPDKTFFLNMFKDCERRALVKLFRHRAALDPPPHL
ncbi:probable hexosyltransferase MUCI70 [Macadamia integrifolia]|uniref:probable hexosyltransferase MUCI70 n=1 Tax=Macadamia integrifolia TaxID=60698 RepID=UPI001C4EA129|nr:probable hexosyltransferase MUCI70 [Macadamia integrifolia]XP_042498616.1 probable hexosyltransferase MUCI70 [Macadamia integrifolia]XP_042498617.1 probable hexosyltransferase MUCI70 [Macadamia integrifolia]XP_042498618.1 probable hexosyltransferase MUCI70 [Macadamia integrifolia]